MKTNTLKVIITDRSGFVGSHVADRLLGKGGPSKALKELSFKSETNLEDGVKNAISWIENNLSFIKEFIN